MNVDMATLNHQMTAIFAEPAQTIILKHVENMGALLNSIDIRVATSGPADAIGRMVFRGCIHPVTTTAAYDECQDVLYVELSLQQARDMARNLVHGRDDGQAASVERLTLSRVRGGYQFDMSGRDGSLRKLTVPTYTAARFHGVLCKLADDAPDAHVRTYLSAALDDA